MGLEPTTVGATIRSYHQLSYAHHPNLHNTIILKSALYNRFQLQKQGETHVVCEFFQGLSAHPPTIARFQTAYVS